MKTAIEQQPKIIAGLLLAVTIGLVALMHITTTPLQNCECKNKTVVLLKLI